jgi:hypothetical protein
VDFFVRTSIPPVEGLFYEGQIFDAWKFASDLVRFAKVPAAILPDSCSFYEQGSRPFYAY